MHLDALKQFEWFRFQFCLLGARCVVGIKKFLFVVVILHAWSTNDVCLLLLYSCYRLLIKEITMKQIVKQGELQKCSSGFFKSYATRMFKMFDDGKMEYYESNNKVRGAFSVVNCKLQALPSQMTAGKSHGFMILTSSGEKVIVVAHSVDDMNEWMFRIDLLSHGRYRWYRHIDALAGHLSLQLPAGERINVVMDEKSLAIAMQGEGYGPERLNELLEEYFRSFNTHVVCFISEDFGFAKFFDISFHSRTIRLVQSPVPLTSAQQSQSTGGSVSKTATTNFRTRFNSNGDLEIYYVKVWLNVKTLGSDLPYSIIVGDIPYVVLKSMKQLQSTYKESVHTLEKLLGETGISVDFSIVENLQQMTKNGISEEHFGQIFLVDHMKQIIEQFSRVIESDHRFRELFMERLVSRKIIVRPSKSLDAVKNHYDSFFTEKGELVIEYDNLLTNLNALGHDFIQLIPRIPSPIEVNEELPIISNDPSPLTSVIVEAPVDCPTNIVNIIPPVQANVVVEEPIPPQTLLSIEEPVHEEPQVDSLSGLEEHYDPVPLSEHSPRCDHPVSSEYDAADSIHQEIEEKESNPREEVCFKADNDSLLEAVELWCADMTSASLYYGHISTWDTSEVTDMQGLFKDKTLFNDDISSWDVSSVTDMTEMFYNAESFNQPLNDWNVGNVISMAGMFYGAVCFNQPIDRWNVENVIITNSMFLGAESFNQSLSDWNVINLVDCSKMFYDANAFNQPLTNWYVAPLQYISEMFFQANDFNQPLNHLNFSEVSDMKFMFYGAKSFNQSLNEWNVCNVIDMTCMFCNTSNFNQSLNCWDVRNVKQMESMFDEAISFNQCINEWNVCKVVNMSCMFQNAITFNQPLHYWNVCNVKNMCAMFHNAIMFNQSLDTWDISQVETMEAMFLGASNITDSLCVSSNICNDNNNNQHKHTLLHWISYWMISDDTNVQEMFDKQCMYIVTLNRLLLSVVDGVDDSVPDNVCDMIEEVYVQCRTDLQALAAAYGDSNSEVFEEDSAAIVMAFEQAISSIMNEDYDEEGREEHEEEADDEVDDA